jgi:hypothetical protein
MRASLAESRGPAAKGSTLLAGARRLLPPPQMAFGQDRALSPGLTWHFWLGAACITLLVVVWRARQRYSAQVQDLFQLYYGAKAWRIVGTAYDLAPVVPLADHALPQFQAGNAYPLPAVLLTLPLSFFPAHVAGIIWLGSLTFGLLLALRLVGSRFWPAMPLYFPLADGLRLEQYTIFVVIVQLLALYAYRRGHGWMLAICCALALTKPTQGLCFALAMFALTRDWRRFALSIGGLWGLAFLVDPRWFFEWLMAIRQYDGAAQQPLFWAIGLLAIPLLGIGDYLGAAILAQFIISPFPIGSAYAAGAVPLTVLDDARSRWLPILALPWILVAHFGVGPGWATALLLVLPVVAIALLRRSGTRRPTVTDVRAARGPRARTAAVSPLSVSLGNE